MPRTVENAVIQNPQYVGVENAWKTLGVAVVSQAVWDWRYYRMKLTKPSKMSREYMKEFRSCEKFLSSPYPEWYANVDGPTILKKLKEGRM